MFNYISESWLKQCVPHFSGTNQYSEKEAQKALVINSFWESYLRRILAECREELLAKERESKVVASGVDNMLEVDGKSFIEPKSRRINVSKSLFVQTYKHKVYELLKAHKAEIMDYDEQISSSKDYQLQELLNAKKLEKLRDLQIEIENLTLNYTEESSHAACPDIMKLMTKDAFLSAKEFVRRKYLLDKVSGRIKVVAPPSDVEDKEEWSKLSPLLSEKDRVLLQHFGTHSLECLLVHTLGYMFNMEQTVRLASLVDRIESGVRMHARDIQRSSGLKGAEFSEEEPSKGVRYPFGKALVEYLIEMGLISIVSLHSDEMDNAASPDGIPSTFVKNVKKKGRDHYRSPYLYAMCNFSTALLPVKLHLPMVHPPADWVNNCPRGKRMLSLTDFYGGYLSNPTVEMYETYRTLTTSDPKSFCIHFGEKNFESVEKAKKLCTSINFLQKQAFKINKIFLKVVVEHREIFERYGFLMPFFLSNLNLQSASKILFDHYHHNEKKDIQSYYKLSELLAILTTNMQRACFEQTIITMAEAYEGYSFYYPAFLDFRGRIYRSGIFHYHERDFARSLILIDDSTDCYLDDEFKAIINENFLASTAFHYKPFIDVGSACEMIIKNLKDISSIRSERSLEFCIDVVAKSSQIAKRPFQFMSNIILYLSLKRGEISLKYLAQSLPITQDASASAYQLMSYFLLDDKMAERTNLINSHMIQDIYEYIREGLILFLKDKLENQDVCSILERIMTRSVVKKIYMPIIYGKTLNSTITDLNKSIGHDVMPKDCKAIATQCFSFWKNKYAGMESFIELIRLVGRVCAGYDRPVTYSTKDFTTYQDYKKMESSAVRVFDRMRGKPRSVTLSFPTNVRDKRKTRTSTFVNFIHQKDASIAMEMATFAYNKGIPLYTVHDNFISNAIRSNELRYYYLKTFKNMGPPLTQINRFLCENLLEYVLFADSPPLSLVLLELRAVYYPGYYDNTVIPDDVMDALFQMPAPPSEGKNKAGWKKIMGDLKSQYSKYCVFVCGPTKKFAEHKRRWDEFASKLEGKYCIHY